jgi:hypothetical protein
MTLFSRNMLIIVLAAALALAPAAASAESPEKQQVPRDEYGAVQMATDLLLGRPLGLAATIVGTALFIVSLPFSAAGGNMEQAGQVLVQAPAEFTFKRPLGDF